VKSRSTTSAGGLALSSEFMLRTHEAASERAQRAHVTYQAYDGAALHPGPARWRVVAQFVDAVGDEVFIVHAGDHRLEIGVADRTRRGRSA